MNPTNPAHFRSSPPPTLVRRLVLLAAALSASTSITSAGERRFGYSYEASTVPRGHVEFENWATLARGTRDDDGARSIAFQHELEYGWTDHAQIDVYLANWTWSDPLRGSQSDTSYDSSAVVLKLNHADPATEHVGVATYHEVKIGDEFLELENKLILEARSGPATYVYNLTLEAEWEGSSYDERSGEIGNSLGVSWEASPRFFYGAELLHEVPLPDWKTDGKANLFAGPNLSYRFGGTADAWITTTALAQLGGADDEPAYQMRVIVGFSL